MTGLIDIVLEDGKKMFLIEKEDGETKEAALARYIKEHGGRI
jgi:hypothetical protein